MTEIVNIYDINSNKLVEDNPELFEEIKIHLTEEEQKLYIANYTTYLKYDQFKDFVVDFSQCSKWVGYDKKANAKTMLVNNFEKNKDYIILDNSTPSEEKAAAADSAAGINIDSALNGRNLGGAGLNKETILLTVNCFKEFCMNARTEKAKQIHRYYIKIEYIYNKIIKERESSLRKQLKDSVENNIDKIEQELLAKHYRKRCFYMCIFKLILNGIEYTIIKFGITDDDVKNRLLSHRNEISKDIKLCYVLDTIYNRHVESKIKELFKNPKDILYNRQVKHKFENSESEKVELIRIDENFTAEMLWNKVLQIEKNLPKDEIFLDLENKLSSTEKELEILRLNYDADLKEEIEKIQLKHKEEIDKKNKRIAVLERPHASDFILPIISYNITTKEEIVFNTLTDARDHYGTQAIASSTDNSQKATHEYTIKNYIDEHRILDGTVLRSSKPGPYWIPPENFKFIEKRRSTQTKYIKGIHKITKEVTYYNSIIEAAVFLYHTEQLNIIKNDHPEYTDTELLEKCPMRIPEGPITEDKDIELIRKALSEWASRSVKTRKEIINSYEWYIMEDIGYLVSKESNERINTDKETEKAPISIKEQLTLEQSLNVINIPSQIIDKKVPIIVRNIDTKEETTISEGYSSNNFSKLCGITKRTFEDMVNQYKTYKNYTFNSINNPMWIPPDNYIYRGVRSSIDYFVKVEKNETIWYFNYVKGIGLHLFPDHPDNEQIDDLISKRFHKNAQNSLEFNDLIKSYTYSRVKSCGTLKYPDGTITKIEEIPYTKEPIKQNSTQYHNQDHTQNQDQESDQ